MKFKALTFALLIAAITGNLALAQTKAEMQQRINEAVLQVYADELAKDPTNYELLNSRANQYFLNGDYLRALDDINLAIKYTPDKQKEMLFEEYMLRSKIYALRDDTEKQLADLIIANRLDPSSVNCLGLYGQACYDLERYDDAEMCYLRILRIAPTNYDAMAGLARVEVMRKNYGKAVEHADKAVKLFSAEPMVYINRAEILTMTEQYQDAAQDRISALSVGNRNEEAIEMLTDLANVQYDAVIAALNNSIDKAPRVGMFYYVKAGIAMNHNHFAEAEKSLQTIIDNKLYDYHGIYADLAESQCHLCIYAKAMSNIVKAIEATNSRAEYFITKAKIQNALGRTDNALATLAAVAEANPNHVPTTKLQALLKIEKQDYKGAVTDLNMAVLNSPEDASLLVLRGWLYKYKLDNKKLGQADFENALMQTDDITSLHGFALHELGRDNEAIEWAQKIIDASPLPGGEAYFNAATLYCALKNSDKAFEYLTKALANGFGSRYRVKADEHPVASLAEIRLDERFDTLLKQYAKVFEAN
mgnify:FL=1